MNLKKYDDARVRLTTVWGEVFEGVCSYNSREYTEAAFGQDEESLQMPFFLFYKGDVKKIELLPDGGPYGGYSAKYGHLEETVLEEGVDGIEEILADEEYESIYRLLVCLEDRLTQGDDRLPPAEALLRVLRDAPVPKDEKATRQLRRVLDLPVFRR